MFASLLTDVTVWNYLLTSPVWLVMTAFQIWMLVHAIRNREWIWALFIFIGWGLSAIFYYFMVYRASPSATSGFELPGAHDRRRIKQLQAQIHHLDKAHHHSQLGDIYFQQGKLEEAEKSYRAAMERDPKTWTPAPILANACSGRNAPPKPVHCSKVLSLRIRNMITATP